MICCEKNKKKEDNNGFEFPQLTLPLSQFGSTEFIFANVKAASHSIMAFQLTFFRDRCFLA
jgi:hypothetical protein